jgi:hypothetical protein
LHAFGHVVRILNELEKRVIALPAQGEQRGRPRALTTCTSGNQDLGTVPGIASLGQRRTKRLGELRRPVGSGEQLIDRLAPLTNARFPLFGSNQVPHVRDPVHVRESGRRWRTAAQPFYLGEHLRPLRPLPEP